MSQAVAMSRRRETLIAIALILRRIMDISQEVGKPGSLIDSLEEEWHRLEMRYQELMDRLEELQQAERVAG
jgi:hypothetical protein